MEKVENYLKLNDKYLKEGDIRSHGEMYRFITILSKETEDSELLRYFSLAGALHQNFYENWLTSEMVVNHSRAVKSLVEKFKRLAR